MCGINKFIEEFLFLFILVFKINFSYNNFKEHVLLGDIYDFVFPSAYTFPDSIESDILWHVTVISGFPSSEVYNSHTYVVK